MSNAQERLQVLCLWVANQNVILLIPMNLGAGKVLVMLSLCLEWYLDQKRVLGIDYFLFCALLAGYHDTLGLQKMLCARMGRFHLFKLCNHSC